MRATAAVLLGVAACAGATHPAKPSTSAAPIGVWRFDRCTGENESVEGTLEVTEGGALILEAQQRLDHPTPWTLRTWPVSFHGDAIEIRGDTAGTPLQNMRHWKVVGDRLYLSFQPIDAPRGGGHPAYDANWRYELRRDGPSRSRSRGVDTLKRSIQGGSTGSPRADGARRGRATPIDPSNSNEAQSDA